MYRVRFIDLDIHMDRRKNIIIANGLNMGGWILTLNDILFENFVKGEKLFDKNTYTNQEIQ